MISQYQATELRLLADLKAAQAQVQHLKQSQHPTNEAREHLSNLENQFQQVQAESEQLARKLATITAERDELSQQLSEISSRDVQVLPVASCQECLQKDLLVQQVQTHLRVVS
jgi:chromosome segregation ATPase